MNYKEYINSYRWKEKARTWRREAGCCEECKSTRKLTCHHKDYDNLGKETRADIIVLCWSCHKKYHRRFLLRQRTGVFPRERKLLSKITTMIPTREQLKKYVVSKRQKRMIRKRKKRQ